MEEKLKLIKTGFFTDLLPELSCKDLESLKIKYLGKKGLIQSLMPLLKDCDKSKRPLIGQSINNLKLEIHEALSTAFSKREKYEEDHRLNKEYIDVTIPGRIGSIGKIHPLNGMIQDTCGILLGMGFSIVECPEIETEHYNYGGLNYPDDHPARDMQDTFYLTEDILLRSHTTSFQQHVMANNKPPFRLITAGKCYRNETITSRSHVFFHQLDAIYVDRGVSFADLLATKKLFYSKIFNQNLELRVRPSYFPFVEPGMEIDIACTACGGKGCALCKDTGWLEVAGAGMVHPNILQGAGIDPEIYSGFAWGGGIERLFMLKHGVKDIRLFAENDMRFLSQF